MKNQGLRIFSFVIMLLSMLPLKVLGAEDIPDPTKSFYVNDYAKVIDKETEAAMAKRGKLLDEKFNAQVVLVTVKSTGDMGIDEYAYNLFNTWGIGDKEKNNGLLILFSIKDDNYWVLQGEGIEKTLTSDIISDMLWEDLEPDFAAKDYNSGAQKIYSAFIDKMKEITKIEEAHNKELIASGKIFVLDTANILSQNTENYINTKSKSSREKYGASFFVVTKKVSKADSIQKDTIRVFEDIKADVKDVVLVLYKEDDNYWILPGAVAQDFATQPVLERIINEVLEPEFAEKLYDAGVISTGDEIYKIFDSSYKATANSVQTAPAADKTKVSDKSTDKEESNVVFSFIVIVLIIWIFIASSRRSSYRRKYGVPFNPYSAKYIRIYGPGGYWGSYGPPPAGGGYWYGGRWNSHPRYSGGHSYVERDEPERTSGHSGSLWGSSGGTGRPSKPSSSGSSSFGGGSSSSSGAGRSFGGSSGTGSRSSQGGGGRASSGGGAGRSSGGGGAGRGSR